MNIANPVANAVPAYDGMWALTTETATWTDSTDLVITSVHDDTTFVYDLLPVSAYDTTVDTETDCAGGATGEVS